MDRINKNYLFDILLILFAVAPVIWSLIIDLRGCCECNYWFQRSGSLMVLFAVLLELNSLKYHDVKGSKNTFVNGKPVAISEEFPTFKKAMRVVGFLLAITGTFIWGYGDLPFKP